jgi:hypothetical protein
MKELNQIKYTISFEGFGSSLRIDVRLQRIVS